MADSQKKSSKKKTNAESKGAEVERPLSHEIWGIVLVTLGICLFLALISYGAPDSAASGAGVNLIGPVGADIADAVLLTGGLFAFFFNAIILFVGFLLLFGVRWRPGVSEVTGYLLSIPATTICLHLLFGGQPVLGHKAGGWIGELGAEIGRSMLGSVGTMILTTATLILAITLVFETNPSALFVKLVRGLMSGGKVGSRQVSSATRNSGQWLAARIKERAEVRAEIKAVAAAAKVEKAEQSAENKGPDLFDLDLSSELSPLEEGPAIITGALEQTLQEPVVMPKVLESSQTGSSKADSSKTESPRTKPEKETLDERDSSQVEVKIPKRRAEPVDEQIHIDLKRPVTDGGYELPSSTMLTAPSASDCKVDHEKLKEYALLLEKALLEFKVKGRVTGITPGPVVTMYEFEPAPGVKLSSIASLSNDLARVIRAQSVRIVAPIPGKGVVGLEVPNDYRETVFLREIVEDRAFTSSRATLPIAIGKDIEGSPVVADLAKMPHLLVAGSTGSGKSVAINAMVMSLLYKHSPEDVRLILVDPKMLELSIYEDAPHLLVPVVTEPGKAASALKWAVQEMERRYQLMSEAKVRNISSYNKAIAEMSDGDFDDPNDRPEKIPFIVIVIDEFADLMMVASKEVEICVTRLAQKARAAGVHLILATQRPSVDVITGLIKANFPTRISFKVFSRVDSRTVLDTHGGETLLGMGDMLFRPPGRGDLQRAHGAFVDEREILEVMDFIKLQGKPEYQEEILTTGSEADMDLEEEDADEMYDMAIALVTSECKASISMVQRKLRVGYNRAARMIEMMERDGIVGPSDGRGTREVIAPPPPPL